MTVIYTTGDHHCISSKPEVDHSIPLARGIIEKLAAIEKISVTVTQLLTCLLGTCAQDRKLLLWKVCLGGLSTGNDDTRRTIRDYIAVFMPNEPKIHLQNDNSFTFTAKYQNLVSLFHFHFTFSYELELPHSVLALSYATVAVYHCVRGIVIVNNIAGYILHKSYSSPLGTLQTEGTSKWGPGVVGRGDGGTDVKCSSLKCIFTNVKKICPCRPGFI